MTREEEIKQKAEIYARYNSRANNTAYYAYIEGAHSMLEEIKQLEWENKHYQDIAWQLAAENEQLRHPWISVEERLPEKGKCVFVRYGNITYSLYSSAYMIEKDLWSIEGYGNGEITHWMPIPQIEKGE